MTACDVCGNETDVATRTFGLDGRTYEVDLCPKDSKDLSKVTARYVKKARKTAGRKSSRRGGHKPRPAAGSTAKARDRKASGGPGKGIYVYGILPGDVEMAAGTRGVGERPGPLRVVRSSGLAALISEVDLSGRLGSPDDHRAHREILDATATEVPVLPLPFGTVLANEETAAEKLLVAHHDEFAAALEQLEGRVEFLVKGRYAAGAAPDEAAPENNRAARRRADTQALEQAMQAVCVASAACEPADELDAVHVAFLVPADKESDAEQVIEDLARDWEGRIEVQLQGPMAAYDFVGTANLFPSGGSPA